MAKKKEEVVLKHMGTHTDMVLRDDIVVHLTIGKTTEKFTIIAEDENGKYFTKKHYVGNGMLDPYRDPERRRSVTALTERDLNQFFPETEKV